MSAAGRLLALACLTLGVIACAPAEAPGTPVPTDSVDLPKSYRFEPAAISVVAGTSVTWTNSDNFTHAVQLDGATAPGLVMKPGESVVWRFDTAGTFAYVCVFHPQDMRGTVVVSGG